MRASAFAGVTPEGWPIRSSPGRRAALTSATTDPGTLFQLAAPLLAACAGFAPRLASVLGPNSSMHLDSLDVTFQDFLDQP
jgi:hypothetical protein